MSEDTLGTSEENEAEQKDRIIKSNIPYDLLDLIIHDEFVTSYTRVLSHDNVKGLPNWIQSSFISLGDIDRDPVKVRFCLDSLFRKIYYDLLWKTRYRQKVGLVFVDLSVNPPAGWSYKQKYYSSKGIPFRMQIYRDFSLNIVSFDILYDFITQEAH